MLENYSSCSFPRRASYVSFLCLVHLPPTNVEWPASLCSLFPPSEYGGPFQIRCRKLPRSLWTSTSYVHFPLMSWRRAKAAQKGEVSHVARLRWWGAGRNIFLAFTVITLRNIIPKMWGVYKNKYLLSVTHIGYRNFPPGLDSGPVLVSFSSVTDPKEHFLPGTCCPHCGVHLVHNRAHGNL